MIDQPNRLYPVLEQSVPFDAGYVYELFRGAAVDIALFRDGSVRWLPLRIALPQENGRAHHRSVLLRERKLGGHSIHCFDTSTTSVLLTVDDASLEAERLTRASALAYGNSLVPVDDGTPTGTPSREDGGALRLSDVSVRTAPRRYAYVPGSERCGHYIGRTHRACHVTIVAEARPTPLDLNRMIRIAASIEAGVEVDETAAQERSPLPPSFSDLVYLARASVNKTPPDVEMHDAWWETS